ncbi:MAG: archaeosine synthase subunit alpha [Halobacteriota archaeon]
MTEYFEVLERDGPARLGELRLEAPVETPALVDDLVEDAGSLWSADRAVPAGDPARLTVLPHRGFPTGTRPGVQAAFAPEVPALDAPAAAVVTPHLAEDLGVDAYVLSGVGGLRGRARDLVEAVVATRRAIPPDAALYLPGMATPANAALLIYLGVDLLDRDLAAIRGARRRYLTPEGERDLEAMRTLPCACPVCAGAEPDDLDGEAVADHNVRVLEATLRLVRDRVRAGQLRDHLEGQVRHVPWLTAALRHLEDEWAFVERRAPVASEARLNCTTDDALRRAPVRRFMARLRDRYEPRLDDRPLVLVPCSATKPYSRSPSHRDFRDAMGYRGHLVSLSSPLGVVPEELELTYPAQHYETPVTGRWSASEREVVADGLAAFLEATDHPRVIAHLPKAGYGAVLRTAVDRAGVDDPIETVAGHPTDPEALAALDEALADQSPIPRSRRHRAILAAIADAQFGAGVGDALLAEAEVRGRYPRLRAYDADGEQLATLVHQYGQLALTLAGARRLRSHDEACHAVAIEAFVPHGSVLAPGVVDADARIRVGDEVVVAGPAALAVGRAAMSGPEMVASSRGIAVDVRHVEER